MAFASLVNGADCGPVNPLASLKNAYGQDRGLQQDRFLPVAGPSSQSFRGQNKQYPVLDHEAAQFYENRSAGPAFDMAPLDRALSPNQKAVPSWVVDFAASQAPQAHSSNVPAWAKDFKRDQRASSPRAQPQAYSASPAAQRYAAPPMFQMQQMPFNDWSMEAERQRIEQRAAQESSQLDEAFHQAHQASQWEKAFDGRSSDSRLQDRSASPPLVQNQRSAATDDALVQTAGDLLESISSDQNPKFKQSGFMNLMRQLRDREVAVEGNSVVEADGQGTPYQSTSRLDKGKGRAYQPVAEPLNQNQDAAYEERFAQETMHGYDVMRDVWDEEDTVREARERQPQRQFQGDGGAITDDMDEEMVDERFDNQNIINQPSAFRQASSQVDHSDWHHLQREWDAFEATATGVRPLHTNNQHALHREYMSEAAQAAMSRTIAQLEAETQQNPQDSSSWLALGIKQQENEREEQAIKALQQALALDPELSDAWLAIAVSYTNENVRSLAYDAIERWIDSRKEYAETVRQYKMLQGEQMDDASSADRHAYLTGMLITMATASPDVQEMGGEAIDADIQVALGVLFNSSEEFDKAVDCLGAALAVRPDDPMLYNRLGATHANSGRAEQAMQYYFRALELQPAYARARYNLAVASISLGNHQEAAEYLLTALAQQESEYQGSDRDVGAMQDDRAGVSNALWETLGNCCSILGHPSLVGACNSRNLAAFVDSGIFAF